MNLKRLAPSTRTMEATLVLPLVLYFAASSAMPLANKVALTLVPAPALVTTVQYVATVVVVSLLGAASVVRVDFAELPSKTRSFWPVPLLFALAIFFNNTLLELANVETFLVVRFSTPLFVSVVDFLIMGRNLPSTRSWLCFVLIIVGAVSYAVNDQGFRLDSYFYAGAYLATIVTEMVVVKFIFTAHDMSNWSRVLLTNLLSIPLQPIFIWLTNEQEKYAGLEWTPAGIAAVAVSCVGGLALAYSGTALRSLVSATTFTLIGVVCKIVTILANFFMWDRHASLLGITSLMVCLLGSSLYRPAKSRDETSVMSWAAWNALDRASCGCLRRCELEKATSGGGGGGDSAVSGVALKEIEKGQVGPDEEASTSSGTTMPVLPKSSSEDLHRASKLHLSSQDAPAGESVRTGGIVVDHDEEAGETNPLVPHAPTTQRR